MGGAAMLETFAQVGEFLGGIVAIAALAYLAVQIRQSNLLARAQSRQTLLDTFSQTNWVVAQNADLARVLAVGIRRWPDMSDADKTTFDLAMARYLSNLHNGLLLLDAGMLDEQTFEGTANYMLIGIAAAGGEKWWRDTIFPAPRVREYIDQRLADPATLPGRFDLLVPHWYALADQSSDRS